MTRLHVAAAQFASDTEKNHNLSEIAAFAAEASRRGARLLLLPEYASFFDPTFGDEFVDRAEPLTGRFATVLEHLAQQYGLFLVAGMNERIDGDTRFRNTLICAAPDGTLQGTYRKIHLYDAFGHAESEREQSGPAAQAVVIDVDGIRVGLQTCYDLRFPEVSRRLLDAGADVLLVPAQWVPGPLKEEHWAVLLAARAIENTAYVLAAGQTAPNGCGRSRLIDPMGIVVASLGTEPGLFDAVIDTAEIARVRQLNPALALRRLHVEPGAPSPLSR